MARSRSKLFDYALYVVVRAFVCVIQMLSWPAALGLARGLAWIAWRFHHRSRQVALDNLRHAFPQLSDAQIERIVRATYDHLFTVLVEMIRLPRVLRAHNMGKYFTYARPGDFERVIDWPKRGRPLLVLTGHFGNWEVLSYITGMYGYRGCVVARRLDNPYLERFLCRFRKNTGIDILDKNEDYPKIQALLGGGGFLGMVGDQDAGARGLFVNFLGRPASTFKSIALLSLEYSAPIMVMGAARIGHPLQYHLYLEDVILPEEYAKHADPVRAITQRYTDSLERMVRRHPEQYFWLHRRW